MVNIENDWDEIFSYHKEFKKDYYRKISLIKKARI